MNELLKALYDHFYDPLPENELKKEIEDCHQQLIETLEKPERRLVLQIIDDKDQIAENRSIDCFIAGFRLAWRLSNELNMYDKTRPMLTPREGGGLAWTRLFMMKTKEKQQVACCIFTHSLLLLYTTRLCAVIALAAKLKAVLLPSRVLLISVYDLGDFL